MSENIAIKPLGDRVVIRPLTDGESGSTSPSGIIIPDTAAKEKSDQGVVVAIGPGAKDAEGKRQDMETKIGDRVIFKTWNERVKIKKEEYWIISESDILGIISN